MLSVRALVVNFRQDIYFSSGVIIFFEHLLYFEFFGRTPMFMLSIYLIWHKFYFFILKNSKYVKKFISIRFPKQMVEIKLELILVYQITRVDWLIGSACVSLFIPRLFLNLIIVILLVTPSNCPDIWW